VLVVKNSDPAAAAKKMLATEIVFGEMPALTHARAAAAAHAVFRELSGRRAPVEDGSLTCVRKL
jgi:hypothetical protein